MVSVVSVVSVAGWVSAVVSVLAGSVVCVTGSVVHVGSLVPVVSGGEVSTGVLVSVEGVVVVLSGVCVEDDSVPVVVIVDVVVVSSD